MDHKRLERECQANNGAMHGALCVDLSHIFGSEHRFIVQGWEHGMSWHLYIDGVWEHPEWYEDPEFKLSILDVFQHQWFVNIPQVLQSKIQKFDIQNTKLTFPLLRLIGRYIQVQELFISEPLLTNLVLAYAVQHKMSEQDVAVLFTQRRTLLMKMLGLPATKAALKLLGKLQYSYLSSQFYQQIYAIFEKPHWQRLNYFQCIEESMLKSANRMPDLIGDKLLSYCSHQRTASFFIESYDTEIFHSRLLLNAFERQKSLTTLKELHGLMRDTLNMLGGEEVHRRAVLGMKDEAALLQLHDGLMKSYGFSK